MNFDFAFRLDRADMSESYDQGRLYGSKWLFGEKVIGVVLIMLGFALIVYSAGETVLPLVLIAIGVFELSATELKSTFGLDGT